MAITNWIARMGALWVERFGGVAPYGQIGKHCKPLLNHLIETEIAAHEGMDDPGEIAAYQAAATKRALRRMGEAWKVYLSQEEPTYASPAFFAQKFSMWEARIQKPEIAGKKMRTWRVQHGRRQNLLIWPADEPLPPDIIVLGEET